MRFKVTERGPKVEAVQHHVSSKPLPDRIPGKHLWIVTGMWRIDPEHCKAGAQVHLDTENLLNLAGPGCFWCEEEWTPELAAQPCRGHG